jgi:hypothetical protein
MKGTGAGNGKIEKKLNRKTRLGGAGKKQGREDSAQ